jgi:hypothetical protein
MKDFFILAVLALSVTFGLSGYSQGNQEPGKDEKKVTLKIVKDENGKVTVIDTTLATKGEGKGKTYQYEYTIQNLDREMDQLEDQLKDMQDRMKYFDVEVRMGDELEDMDSVIRIGDSIEKHIMIRGMGPDCKRPFNFDFRGDDFDVPEFPMPPQWEALLQSVPMGKIKGFQVKDRKDGKRIIIDVDDEYPMVIMEPYVHKYMNHRGKMGHGGNRIIIEREIQDVPPPPPPPPPPPADQKDSPPKQHKG